MPIYKIDKSKLTPINEKAIDLEKDIQKLTEDNLEIVFGLQFVRSEFPLQNFRIDTLAFDKEANALVIIEYKRDKGFSVIDQGFSYLSLMLNNKADFVLEYNKVTGSNLNKDSLDWTQARVLFLAQSFTTYQQSAINFRDLPFELWEVKVYDNQTLLYNQVLASKSNESIKTFTKNKAAEKIAKEVKVYTIEDHLQKGNDVVKSIFYELQEKIFSIGTDIKEVPKKQYIAYKKRTNFVDVIVYTKELRLTLNLKSGQINDPKKLTKDFTKPAQGHWGNGDYEIRIRNTEDIPYVMTLIEQSYKRNQ